MTKHLMLRFPPPPHRQAGLTPLQTAKTPELKLALLGKGANPNVADKDGNTPLHEADSVELMAALLEHGWHGADLEAANKVFFFSNAFSSEL